MEREVKKSDKRVYESAGTKIVMDKNKVEVIFAGKKVTYYAKGNAREYANYALVFDETASSEETKDYANVLIGIDMIPSFAHLDADLAGKLYSVIVDDLGEKLAVDPRAENEQEDVADAQAILSMQIDELMKA